MYKAKNGNSRVLDQRYKKLVGQNADYLALVSHYPSTQAVRFMTAVLEML